MTITRQIARWSTTVTFGDLPDVVVAEAKRFLLDTIGCAFGGWGTADVRIALDVLAALGGTPECTLIGEGGKTSVVNAALANALMVRALDYNDIYWKQDPSHPSDIIPGVLALAEQRGLTGRDLLVGIAIAYEIEMRLCEFAFPGIREKGWHHATLTAVASPFAAGRMIGLDVEKTVHAVGISASPSCSLGAVTAGKLTMMKNTVDPMAVQAGVLAALLAERGYTGPEHVLDGKEGISHALFGSEYRMEILTDGLGETWRLPNCGMKAYPTEALTHAPISCTLRVLRENGLTGDDVERVEVRTLARAADILCDPSKYDPRSKETADHSLPWCLAAALGRGKVTTDEFSDSALEDEGIRKHLRKVVAVVDAEAEAAFPDRQLCTVTLHTTDKRELSARVEYPKGDPRDPMSNAEIRVKFDALCGAAIPPPQRDRIWAAVAEIEEWAVADFMQLLVANG
jgi:2-methylcitrate dehydratase